MAPIVETAKETNSDSSLYLDLMIKVLAGTVYEDPAHRENFSHRDSTYREEVRNEGRDWPANAHTMIGIKRLDNIRQCVEDVIGKNVPGDLVETGVWRGGACILMRGILRAHDVRDRTVWVADSFQGIPDVGEDGYAGDRKMALHRRNSVLAVSEDEVRRNFRNYDLLDEQVRFLPGWFKDTLPTAPIDTLAVLRMDGDLYESTWDTLTNLYPKVSVGGYVIVDDYMMCPPCKDAVDEYRAKFDIADELITIDRDGVYWQRTR
ncbi:demethyldecarbamoylnovobiocin O-methyltransferase [Streptomyces niveus]|uniref:demethyldecarbamoylnovobiocin O-methyltransferase n=1 Tax=Streptomyces niveus TaxID=193462 RepID=UPI002E3627F8|nr:demethyldecarbamoylnovobiocin O-methyltransferase [Streptomyces niveus]